MKEKRRLLTTFLFSTTIALLPTEGFSQVIYQQTFDDESAFNTMLNMDEDGDGKKWFLDEGAACNEYTTNDAPISDWLITPELELEAGWVYELTYKIKGANHTELYEFLQISYGKGDNPDTYTKLNSDIEVPKTDTLIPVRRIINITETGKYKIAFHASSLGKDEEKKQGREYGRQYFDDVVIEKKYKAGVPNQVSNLTVTPAKDGILKANISFTTPNTNLGGTNLEDLSKIVVTRDDGKTVAAINNPEKGKDYKITDENARIKDNTYTVTIFNKYGEGLDAEVSTYVGIDTPNDIETAKATDKGDKIDLTWEAPTTGKNGHYFDANKITYNVYSIDNQYKKTLLASNLKGTSFSLDNNFDGAQQTWTFAVTAVSDAGESSYKSYNMPSLVVGKAYEAPFRDSFSDGTTPYYWWTETSEIFSSFKLRTSKSQDDDGGCQGFVTSEDTEESLNSGKISLQGTTNPKLRFSYQFALKNTATGTYPGDIYVEVVQPDKTDAEEIKHLQPADMTLTGWNTVTVDLSKYKDTPYIYIKFRCKNHGVQEIYIDNVSVGDAYNKDLAIKLNAPTKAIGGENCTASARIYNYGTEDAKSFTVKLYANEEEIASKTINKTKLKAQKNTTTYINFAPKVGIDAANLQAKVIYDGDEFEANNLSDITTLSLSQPTLTKATDLKSQSVTNGVNLTWSKPAYKTETITDDFENYEPFIINNIGPWKVYDGDDSWTTAIPVTTALSESGVERIEFPNAEEAYAYIVFNAKKTTPSIAGVSGYSNITAHSGDQCLAAFAPAEDMDVAADDWLISPILTGQAQTIKFWVQGPASNFKEPYTVYYSTSGNDPKDFTTTGSGEEVKYGTTTADWTEVTCDLPEGAKYFAINYTANDLFMIQIDDITYTVGDGEFLGYNVYRDGEKIATLDANATTYTDDMGNKDSKYQITALYTRGESGLTSVGETTSIEKINNTQEVGKVSLYNLNGQKINEPSHQGVYIVRQANGKTFKVIKK